MSKRSLFVSFDKNRSSTVKLIEASLSNKSLYIPALAKVYAFLSENTPFEFK